MMEKFGAFLQNLWLIDGISEFASALLGGGFAIAAQQLALRHDRKKEAQRISEEKKARGWAVFFKIHEINEVFSNALIDIEEAKKISGAEKLELWQILQFPPHDMRELQWDIDELVLLIDAKLFDVMQRYQEAVLWLSNFIQSSQYYREMRVEFLRGRSSSVSGDRGSMLISNKEEYDAVMPTIVHLRSLANSLAQVIGSQQPDVRQLFTDYTEAMGNLIGHRPKIEFVAGANAAATTAPTNAP